MKTLESWQYYKALSAFVFAVATISVICWAGGGANAQTTLADTPAHAVGPLTIPPYPPLSQRLGEQGTTVLQVSIDSEGGVTNVAVTTSSGSARLDEAAVAYAQIHWKFHPAIKNGVPVSSTVLDTVHWSLNAVSASLPYMLRSQIRPCWSPIAGAPNPADQIVSFDLQLNPDGTIASLKTLTDTSNPYTATAVLAAERAINQCSPYRLPGDSYNQWRQFRPLRFDPRQMVQQ